MKVLFTKDLKGQGKKGEIKDVKDGYAQNFLIKKGYAEKLTENTLNSFQKEKAFEKSEDERLNMEAKSKKEKMEKLALSFKVKTGKDDKVFGSISPKQIKEELEKLGYNIDKKDIIAESSLASLGYHDVKITLYKKTFAKIKIHIEK